MGDGATQQGGPDALRSLGAAVDAVWALQLESLSDSALLEQLRERERLRRRLAAADQALLAELEARLVAPAFGYASTAS